MTPMEAATLYAGLSAILLLVLKVNVARVRIAEKVMFGDGANERIQRAIRAQGNAVEDVPIAMIALMGLGLVGGPVLLIHGTGIMLMAGRLLHAVGLGNSTGSSFGRSFGTLLSFLAMVVIAIAAIWCAVA